MSDEPKPLSVWRHYKGGLYVVIGVAACSTNGPDEGEPAVVYQSTTHRELRYRSLSEFMDGRFTEVQVVT